MKTCIFVYGTLKRSCCNHFLMSDQEFVCTVHALPRYRLYDSGPYPCLVEDPRRGVAVVGEVWRVDAEALARLDEFEEVSHLFDRRPIQLRDFAEPVFAYFYRGDVSGFSDVGACWPATLAVPLRQGR